jgi:hypothetical protein
MMLAALPAPSDAPASGPVIPSTDLEALLARRDAAVGQLRTIAGAVAAYRDVGDAIWPPPKEGEEHRGAGSSSARFTFDEPTNQQARGRGHWLGDDRWLEASIAAVDASLWDHLLDATGLRTFLDHKAREEWREQIEQRRTPPLTPENVRATFQGLHARRGEFFERGVCAVFRSLSWDYKTNRPHAFGRRIVVRGVHGAYGFPDSRRCDLLDDLERAFHVLDGKPEPDHREGTYQRLSRRNRSDAGSPLGDAYLSIRTFKNGNAHVTFLRPDLVDEMNRILARHYPDALPPARD